MNPLLQRILVSLAAASTASGVIVGSAKKRDAVKRKKRKPKKDGSAAEVLPAPGTQAAKDMERPITPGMTFAELGTHISDGGKRVASFFMPTAKVPVDDTSATVKSADGARVPDELLTKDGTRLRVKAVDMPRTNVPQKKGAKARRRKRQQAKRPQASLYDSAKESLRQTMREVVRDEVNASPLGGALNTIKGVSAKVQQTAAKAVDAVRARANAAEQGLTAAGASTERLHTDDAAQAPLQERAQELSRTVTEAVGQGAAQLDDTLERVAQKAADAINSEPPAVVADVAKKVAGGVDVVGGWLAGPGSPGYRRAGSRVRRGSTGEVVEAREGGSTEPVAASTMGGSPGMPSPATGNRAPPADLAATESQKTDATGS